MPWLFGFFVFFFHKKKKEGRQEEEKDAHQETSSIFSGKKLSLASISVTLSKHRWCQHVRVLIFSSINILESAV